MTNEEIFQQVLAAMQKARKWTEPEVQEYNTLMLLIATEALKQVRHRTTMPATKIEKQTGAEQQYRTCRDAWASHLSDCMLCYSCIEYLTDSFCKVGNVYRIQLREAAASYLTEEIEVNKKNYVMRK